MSSVCNNYEQFISYWQSNPKEMCNFVGRAVAHLSYQHFPDLYFAMSTSYFEVRKICERINYIYDNYQNNTDGECGLLLDELVEISEQNGIICLKDKAEKHRGIRVMLLRDTVDGYPIYSLRYFEEPSDDNICKEFWDEQLRGKPNFLKVLQLLPQKASQLYEDERSFWNFRQPVEPTKGVIVYFYAQGFYNISESKSLADFIVLTSNLLGFKISNYVKNELIDV